MKPSSRYLAEVEQGILISDPLQLKVVEAFDRIYTALLQPQKKSFFSRPKPIPGVYVYGTVGRGKTHLMDLFYDGLPDAIGKRRSHYHEFMLWLHQQLRLKAKKQNPLDLIIRDMAKDIRLLCLDEFLVNDITNAMLLAGLFKAFEKYGIALVTTSNVRPDDLYHDGLQRAKFLPAIQWIHQYMEIKELDGEHDYRYNEAQQSIRWFFPLNSSCDYHLQDVFEHIADVAQTNTDDWDVNGRTLPIVKNAGRVTWCDFDTLCRQPRGAADYINVCGRCDHLLLSGVPRMDDEHNNEARRFLTLIDVMYEHETLLTASAEAHYESIYQGTKLAFEFKRAVSRLNQLLTAKPF
ncbi:cell division protein ZapE [Marinicella sp. W31]|uniref:cell division protein ZapE n=1 Tax=Marinicella sp. W31 TaxID=3023713 RepID=UPI003757D65A